MGADQIAEIRPPIAEVFEAHLAGEDWCAGFSLVDHDAIWIEATREYINFAYPYEVHPQGLLAKLGLDAKLSLISWESRKFVTLSYPSDLLPRDVARCIDDLFRHNFALGDNYHVDVTLEELE